MLPRILLVLLMLFSGIAAAQSWPTRQVRFLVPFPPGGSTDVAARTLAEKLSTGLGQQAVVENRGGAGGAVGAGEAARAQPDGYTILFAANAVSLLHLAVKNLPYDTLRDFVTISLLTGQPNILVAHPSLAAKSLKDFVALAKAQPGKITYGSGGTGQSSHMAMELFKLVAGMDLVHVPYKGAGPGMTAIIAGEVGAMFAAIPAAAPHIKANRLRALAVGGAQRSALLPDTPTIAESGFRFDASSWYGVLAPKNTPRAIVARLHDTLVQTLTAPAMRARLTEIAFDVEASSPDAFAAHLRRETATWSKVVAAVGLRGK